MRQTLELGGTGFRIGAARVTWFLRFKWSVSLSLGSWNLVVPETFFTETEAKEAAQAPSRLFSGSKMTK